MKKGFLSKSTLDKFELSRVASCNKCGLYKKCKSPKMPVTGKGRKKILVVAEAPGRKEDYKNTQLIGKSGQRLRKSLRKFGIDLDRDCWKTNAVICFPDGTPTEKQVQYCFPNLKKTVKDLQPDTIIVLGSVSLSSLIGWLWKPKPGAISKWAGWKIPAQKINAWVCPTYHPSYLLRQNNPNVDLEFDSHLEAAINLTGKPWVVVPQYDKEIEIVINSSDAARMIREMISRGGTAAWDLECTTLKPDGPEAEIVCCSICWEGKRTISFPWEGEVIKAMEEFLLSPIKKIAANLKYETRYVAGRLGVRVKNWYFDTMLAAHILDNRREVTGLKFQSFVKLGQPSYDGHIEPFLKSKNSNNANRAREIPLSELLLYCGMDSLLEYKLAKIQMKELEIE